MASTWTDFDVTKPDAATQAGAAFGNSANTNGVASVYNIIAGNAAGWVFAPVVGTGSAEQPQYLLWTKGTYRVRGNTTWGSSGGSNGNITQIIWQVSQDSGTTPDSTGTWAYMGANLAAATQGFTYDSNGNLTATTNAGGFSSMLAYLLGKVKVLLTAHNAHVAATGAAVHGLNTMSTQSAAAVAITGGTINGASVGLTTPAEGRFTRACEAFNTYTPGAGAGVTVDWANGGSVITNNGVNVLAFSNVPSTRIATHLINCSNFNNTTFPAAVSWGVGGKPSVAGQVVCSLITYDGGTTVFGTVVWRAV